MNGASKEKEIIFLIFALGFIFLLSCTQPGEIKEIAENKQCITDADCVPASCCHPKDAVNKAFAPNCEGVACTLECAPETLDCGQGEVKCVKNECKAMLK